MARKYKPENRSGRTILLVDDNEEYLEATRLILVREGHTVVTANGGRAALDAVRSVPVDLMLLDYLMPGMTGEQVVAELRKFNTDLQVILQTGYASENPPRELLQRLDIQGYYDKSEGTEKLLLWVDVGLKAAFTVRMLSKSRRGLDYILKATPDMHRIRPLDELLQGILLQVSGLLGSSDSFLAVLSRPASEPPVEGFLALFEGENVDLRIHAGVGRFAGMKRLDDSVPGFTPEIIVSILNDGRLTALNGMTLVPLRVGESSIGVVYLDRKIVDATELELLEIFANQAAVAIQNTQLYEMATTDPLTGVFVRRFFNRYLIRELRNAHRSGIPLGLLMLDLDGLKRINDSAGHLVGDRALSLFARSLKEVLRSTDLIGRYGGDEFCVLLLKSDAEGTALVTGRILEKLRTKTVRFGGGEYPLGASIGCAVLLSPDSEPDFRCPEDFFERLALHLHQSADESMYEAKNAGGNRSGTFRVLAWPEASKLPALPEKSPMD